MPRAVDLALVALGFDTEEPARPEDDVIHVAHFRQRKRRERHKKPCVTSSSSTAPDFLFRRATSDPGALRSPDPLLRVGLGTLELEAPEHP